MAESSFLQGSSGTARDPSLGSGLGFSELFCCLPRFSQSQRFSHSPCFCLHSERRTVQRRYSECYSREGASRTRDKNAICSPGMRTPQLCPCHWWQADRKNTISTTLLHSPPRPLFHSYTLLQAHLISNLLLPTAFTALLSPHLNLAPTFPSPLLISSSLPPPLSRSATSPRWQNWLQVEFSALFCFCKHPRQRVRWTGRLH